MVHLYKLSDNFKKVSLASFCTLMASCEVHRPAYDECHNNIGFVVFNMIQWRENSMVLKWIITKFYSLFNVLHISLK